MNLLTDPLLSADPLGPLTLPGLFGASAHGEVRGFPRLRAHQRAAWHMFRVQLAALALDRGGLSEAPRDEDAWRDLLLGLTGGKAGPWDLVGADRATPAFLQPPDPGGLNWEGVPTPDALDLLITSKNHDLKGAVAGAARPEDWVLALVSLQTSEGFGGRGNYGIARMNGGSSSRAFLGLAPAGADGQPDPSAWWARDLGVLLRSRQADPQVTTRGGHALLWTHPWPEDRQIPAPEIDPWAIEVCRRVRLVDGPGGLRAERANSKAARVDAKAFAGVLDDPWAPVSRKDGVPKTLTLGEGGRFHYRRMVDLLSGGDWVVPLAARLEAEAGEVAGDMVVVAEALARGNSKTDGLRTRTIPVPKDTRRLGNLPARIGKAADEMLADIKAADKALVEAVVLYAVGGDYDRLKDEKGKPFPRRKVWPRSNEAKARLDAAVDRVFFEHLWTQVAAFEVGADARIQAARAFRNVLVETAEAELARAFGSLPCAAIRAPRARVRATARLRGALRKSKLIEEAHA